MRVMVRLWSATFWCVIGLVALFHIIIILACLYTCQCGAEGDLDSRIYI